MDAAILYGQEDVRIERIPVPPIGQGEVLLRICTALTCGTDVKVFKRGYHARMLTPPCPFGHEMAGEIEAVGEGVTEWNVGDRVVAANSAPCGICFYCARNQPELCEDLLFVNGAYAQFITLPERIVRTNLLRIPRELTFDQAALLEPLACVVHGFEESCIQEDHTVAVIGAGPIGLLFARLCKLAGARVICVSRNSARLGVAERIGADVTISSNDLLDSIASVRKDANDGRGPDRVIECAGTPESWAQALAIVRKGGLVNLFSGCESGTNIILDTARVHYDALTIRATFHHTPQTVRRALCLLEENRIQHDLLITDSAELSDLPLVLRGLAAGDGNLKVAIHPS